MRYIYHLLIFISFFISGCATKTDIPKDLKIYSQSIEPYLENFTPVLSYNQQLSFNEKFDERFFSPWSIDSFNISQTEAFWAFNVYFKSHVYYGENRLLVEDSWFETVKTNANLNSFNTINKKAITITNTPLRNMPSHKPLFLDFEKAGEGYPFDYLQNSTVKANTPILISHFTHDGSFAFIKTHFAYGWVDSRDIAFVDDEFIDLYKNSKLLVITTDNTPILNKESFEYFYHAKIGTIFPLADVCDNNFEIFIAKKDINQKAIWEKISISKEVASIKPLRFEKENIQKIANELLSEKYGWGGYLENRDCSLMIQDFFAPFGIWLPRNSKAQGSVGEVVYLDNLSFDEKIEKIDKMATPFLTLLYLKGHIMLYIGSVDNNPLVMHNSWGIRTNIFNTEGRYIIGKAIISSLFLGEDIENVDKSSLLINRIKSFNTILK